MPVSPSLADASPRARRFSLVLWLLAAVVIACAAIFVVMTRHWPMVQDAALLHYDVFLIQQGWAPYRDFVDINMPGAYWTTATAMHLPGQPDVAWRIFDLTLIALAGLGYYFIARPYSLFAALFAAVMLQLVHGQDGVQQAGQRDLVIAVLLVLAFACLLEAMRQNRWMYLLPFGVGIGLAATIKPTADPLGVLLLAMVVAYRARRQHADRSATLAWLAAGLGAMATPLAAMLLWLEHKGALKAWIAVEHLVLPYYATLERRPLGFTFAHSISPLAALIVLWLLCLVLRGPEWPAFERLLVATAVVVNLLGLLAQGKALPYQRYPMLVFLLLLIALDLSTACRRKGTRPVVTAASYVALGGLCCGCFIIAPLALARVHRFVAKPQEFDVMLAADLHRVNGGHVSGRVQCLDTVQDCLPTLYTIRLLPATGILSDQPLFDPVPRPAVDLFRRRFQREVTARPPLVFVAVSGYFLDSGSGYRKLDTWPAFKRWLETNYTLAAERTSPGMVHWWSRPQPQPGYRLYLLKGTPSQLGTESR